MYHLVIYNLSEENLPCLAVTSNDAGCCPLMVHRMCLMVGYAAPLLSSNLTNIHEYGFFQSPTVLGNSSRILPATKSPTCLLLAGAGNVQ